MRLIPRLRFPALVAVGLVFGGIALTPGTAAASCGNYVIVQNEDRTGQPQPVPAVPCHGPGCSKAPGVPTMPMTAPVTTSTTTEQLTANFDSDADLVKPSGWGRPLPNVEHPIRLASSIFHPPRAS
jgi:hypothetical protein